MRNRAYLRHQYFRTRNRKYNLLKEKGYDMEYVKIGKLGKGKIHCSCLMCNWHKVEGTLKVSDIKQLAKYTDVRHIGDKKSSFKLIDVDFEDIDLED